MRVLIRRVDLIIGRWGAVGKANTSVDPSVDLVIGRWGAVGELRKEANVCDDPSDCNELPMGSRWCVTQSRQRSGAQLLLM